MSSTLESSIRKINRIKSRSNGLALLIRVVRSLLLGLVMIALWASVAPGRELEQLLLGVFVFFLTLFLGNRNNKERIKESDVLLDLEMSHNSPTEPAATLREESSVSPKWRAHLTQQIADLRRYESKRLLTLLSTLIAPLIITFFTVPKAAPGLQVALEEVSNVVATLNRGATLKVLRGATSENQTDEIKLSTSKVTEIELLAQNLIEITVNGSGFKGVVPTAELHMVPDEFDAAEETSDKAFQTFQLPAIIDPNAPDKEPSLFKVAFAVTEEVELVIPALGSEPLARFKVKKLPVPKVNLTLLSEKQDPWPDDQPLTLQIDVKAKNPLQMVRLLIKSGQRVSKELVANVMTEDKKDLSTTYSLILESYVESDIAEVEIIAEAIDRAVPTPLAGYSKPLRLTTASAYGRYRQTLRTLRELKSMVDDALGKQDSKLPDEASTLTVKAANQSEQSPFFDGRDRVQIGQFRSKVAQYKSTQDSSELMDLSAQLNDFLFEHELLDDRERDRDFFVAARSMSRLIEQKRNDRPVSVKEVSDRIQKFLDDRLQRWRLRVGRLGQTDIPEQWADVSERSFQNSIQNIADAESMPEADARKKQLDTLSKTVVAYRQWIEQLEAAEDKVRAEQDQQRREGLASARNVLKELQKRQGDISQKLDRASPSNKDDMEGDWPSTRMKQNTNLGEASQLEGQMRSLSPTAGARIKAATEAMKGTISNGNQGDFMNAETDADLAGRLLRQADSAAQQSQRQRQSRGRRRRVTGDNYYGQSVVGGDVEITRDYQVDKRYREDVLNDVEAGGYGEEHRALMESYLREIVR